MPKLVGQTIDSGAVALLGGGQHVQVPLLVSPNESRGASWFGGEGNWDVDKNWIPMQVPNSSDGVSIGAGIAKINGGVSAGSQSAGVGLSSAPGAIGAVEVKGEKARWNNSLQIDVGRGRVLVDQGGAVSTGSIVLGYDSGTGQFHVAAANSVFSTGPMTIGWRGEGIMLIEDGGKVLTAGVVLGRFYGTSGQATIADQNSVWQIAGPVHVGADGMGAVSVVNGGAVTSGLIKIGYVPGGVGLPSGTSTVTVSGRNSSWMSSGTLSLTSFSILTIKERGKFVVSSDALIESASVIVTGAGSQFSTGGYLTTIKGSGNTFFSVYDGATATTTSTQGTYIARQSGSRANVIVSGQGSHWSNTGPIHVGEGRADLTVENGGKITMSNITVGGQNVIINNIKLNGGDTPQFRGAIETAFLTFNVNGGIKIDGGILRATADQTSFIRHASPEILLRGAFIDTNGFTVGIDVPFHGAGGLTKQGEGILSLIGFPITSNTYLGATTVEQGMLQVASVYPLNGNLLPITTALVVGNTRDTGVATFNLNGFNQEVGSLSSVGITMSRIVTNTGATLKTLAVNQSIDTTFSGQLDGNLNLVKTGVGTLALAGASTHSGSTTIIGGSLVVDGSIAGNVTVATSGTLKGNGNVGSITVHDGGVLSPGDGLGILNVSGGLFLSAGATYSIELGGTNPGLQYDQTHITGNLFLDGALTVQLIGGFQPAAGDKFDILDWTGTLSGTFSSLNLPVLAGSLTWDTSQLCTAGVLSVTGSTSPDAPQERSL